MFPFKLTTVNKHLGKLSRSKLLKPNERRDRKDSPERENALFSAPDHSSDKHSQLTNNRSKKSNSKTIQSTNSVYHTAED